MGGGVCSRLGVLQPAPPMFEEGPRDHAALASPEMPSKGGVSI